VLVRLGWKGVRRCGRDCWWGVGELEGVVEDDIANS